MESSLQIKQYVCDHQGAYCRFRVFETADPKFYLFAALDPDGCDHGLHIPVCKSELRSDVRRNLRHGYGRNA